MRRLHALFGLAGPVLAAWSWMTRRPASVHARVPGSAARVRVRLGTTDVAVYTQVFVHRLYDVDMSRAPAAIVDAGAGTGLASVRLAVAFPGARILALEPERSNFELLKENVKDHPGIVPIQAALWSEPGELDVQDPGRGHWGFTTSPSTGGAGDAHGRSVQTVRATTMDELIRDFGLERIDLLKMNVEGAEKEVFSTSSRWMGRVGCICAALHDRFRPGCSRAFVRATEGFEVEWARGGLLWVARAGMARAPR